MQNFFSLVLALAIIIGVVWLYMRPTIIAIKRKHEKLMLILFSNLFFGWNIETRSKMMKLAKNTQFGNDES